VVVEGLHDDAAAAGRRALAHAKRLVVKVGSSSLTDAEGHLDTKALGRLAEALATKANQGKATPTGKGPLPGTQIVLVTSGAVAAGLKPLGFASRPTDLASVQAAASVGQSHLIAEYDRAFAKHGLIVAQVLLTASDTVRRKRYENSRRTLDRLLQLGVIPIVNENDAVTVAELKFGDNDRLAALTALLVRADGLVLLTDVPGLYNKSPKEPDAQRIPYVGDLTQVEGISITSHGSSVGTGGMVTKLDAVQIATTSGIPTILAGANQIVDALNGGDVGTYFAAGHRRASGRMHWLAHAAVVRGRLTLDDGAAAAVRNTGASLLAVGVTKVTGDFEAGDPIELANREGHIIARGLAAFNSIELPQLLGRNSRWLHEALGERFDRPVVHRDDLVLID